MSSSNRVTLAHLAKMQTAEVAALPLDQISLLLEDVAELKAQAKGFDDLMSRVLHTRFNEAATAARKAKGADTGTVRLTEDGFTIIADCPKKVTWAEAGLADVERQLTEMGEPIADYIKIKRDVHEAKFVAWPESLKKIFLPHRTLGIGKPNYRLERITA